MISLPRLDDLVLEESSQVKRVPLSEKVQETATSGGYEAAESRLFTY